MNADLSVAPEIAQLAASPAIRPPRPGLVTVPRTVGAAAAELTRLAVAPQLWWDLVRFDPAAPVRIPVPGTAGAWLFVLPPGATAACDCHYATLLAGQAAESPVQPPPAARPSAALHAGRVRVHGRRAPHLIHGASHGYSVSLHLGTALQSAAVPPGE